MAKLLISSDQARQYETITTRFDLVRHDDVGIDRLWIGCCTGARYGESHFDTTGTNPHSAAAFPAAERNLDPNRARQTAANPRTLR